MVQTTGRLDSGHCLVSSNHSAECTEGARYLCAAWRKLPHTRPCAPSPATRGASTRCQLMPVAISIRQPQLWLQCGRSGHCHWQVYFILEPPTRKSGTIHETQAKKRSRSNLNRASGAHATDSDTGSHGAQTVTDSEDSDVGHLTT